MRQRMLWTAEEVAHAFAVSWTSAHHTLDDTVAPILLHFEASLLLTALYVIRRATFR